MIFTIRRSHIAVSVVGGWVCMTTSIKSENHKRNEESVVFQIVKSVKGKYEKVTISQFPNKRTKDQR